MRDVEAALGHTPPHPKPGHIRQVPRHALAGVYKPAVRRVFALAGLVIAGAPSAHATAASAATPSFRDELRSGGFGPELVVVPAGRFRMGCDRGEPGCTRERYPPREVVFAAPFAMSKHEITFDDYDRLLSAKRRRHGEAHDQGWGRGRRPVINVSWDEGVAYAAWLSAQTGRRYRLPSEAEWEYAARAGTTTKWPWGDAFQRGRANCAGCGGAWGGERTTPAGSFPPNPWGLHDMHGNVTEMLLDCFHIGYGDAPTDGSPQTAPGRGRMRNLGRIGKKGADGQCVYRVARGASWNADYPSSTSSTRFLAIRGQYGALHGIRIVRELGGGGMAAASEAAADQAGDDHGSALN